MLYNPEMDGVEHINVYSKGRTSLGKWMSNFTREPINTEDGPFASIEGYWYWLTSRDDRLRNLSGFEAKKLGRELPEVFEESDFKAKIERAIRIKAINRPDMVAELRKTTLPLVHYYVFNDQTKDAGYKWILDVWNNIRFDRA